MKNGFDKEGFMNWLREEFPGVIDAHWNYDLVENIIDYAVDQKNTSDDELVIFLLSMFSEIEYAEIEKFVKKI